MSETLPRDGLAQHICSAVNRYLSASPGDGGIEQLLGQYRAGIGGQDYGHLIKFRALGLVDGHGEGRFMGWQTNWVKDPELVDIRREVGQEPAVWGWQDDADVTIEQLQNIVISQDHQRPAGVPMAAPVV